jgi:hypothetical protein
MFGIGLPELLLILALALIVLGPDRGQGRDRNPAGPIWSMEIYYQSGKREMALKPVRTIFKQKSRKKITVNRRLYR